MALLKSIDAKEPAKQKKESKTEKKRSVSRVPRSKDTEPKDPYRWVPFAIMMVMVFLSYLFWISR